LQNPDPNPDPYLEAMDSDPKQEMHLIKNHLKIIQKISNLIITRYRYDIKKTVNYNIFFKKYALKCHEKAFFIAGIVKEGILIVGSETGSVTFY
jgi:hypothetical protein